jgi:hypothetical protein
MAKFTPSLRDEGNTPFEQKTMTLFVLSVAHLARGKG